MWGFVLIWLILVWVIILVNMFFRTVVPTNEMHIIQRSSSTKTYWKWQEWWNTYFNWPSWFPIIGIKRIILPATIFDITIDNYEAFDNGRVPFRVNVKWFFRIDDFNLAAERNESMTELKDQLTAIVSSAIRVILANKDINKILAERSELGKEFMDGIVEDLKDFWVTCTKNIELMDITDSENSKIIYNIQKKKESEIEKDARVSIAENEKEAKEKEIESERRIEIAQAEKDQEVWKKQVESKKEVSMEEERANQEINEQKKLTIEKQMEVLKTEEIQRAEIEKQKAEIEKEKEKSVKRLEAEAEAESIKAIAKGRQEASENDAKAIVKKWEAEAKAKELILLAEAEWEKKKKEASIADDIAMLKEITMNKWSADYLQIVKAIEMFGLAEQKKAEALQKADIKFLSTWSENQYWEFLWKLWLWLETFKEFKWVWNIQELVKWVVNSFNKDKEENKNNEQEKENNTNTQTEIIDVDKDTKQTKKK